VADALSLEGEADPLDDARSSLGDLV